MSSDGDKIAQAINSAELFLLFIVFLVLKLTNVINWSWWWVTIPLWGPLLIGLVVVLIFLIVVNKRLK